MSSGVFNSFLKNSVVFQHVYSFVPAIKVRPYKTIKHGYSAERKTFRVTPDKLEQIKKARKSARDKWVSKADEFVSDTNLDDKSKNDKQSCRFPVDGICNHAA